MDREKLDEEIKSKPEKAGVYIFRDGDVPVYIGKAVDIKERLKSYRDPRSTRIGKMVEKADSIDSRVTEDEKEALLLEANLIKKFQPNYNTRLKDSKSYPVIQLTSDKFPAIEATRDPDESATVFGPYTSMKRVRNSIKAIRDTYGITSPKCKRKESEDDPCMDYQIGLCSAPYAGKIEAERYTENVREARESLEKGPEKLINHLKSSMKKASEENKFERAATLRDYIEDLKKLGGDKSFSETGMKHVIALNKALDRVGLIEIEASTIQKKEFYRLNENAEKPEEAYKAFITQFYAADSLPEEIIAEKKIDDEEIISWLVSEGTDYKAPEDGRDRVLIDSAISAAKRPQDTKMKDLGEILGLKVDRMECFDVSHTGGKNVVGSNVVFEDDKPVKSDYRKKKLKEENNDYENMYKLLKWRAERHIKGRDGRPEPDILLIDGGEGQLNAAANALREVGWSMPVFGIVKPDDKILGLHRNPEIPDKTGQILSAIRDEAHRFAKQYHEKRRDKIKPVLEEIDGLGEETRKALMREFTIEELRQVSPENIEERVDGVGENLSEKIKDYIKD
jgi:excinuclease ABC subunit C